MEKPTPQQELETLVGALIAQLHQAGIIGPEDVEAIARRVHQSGMPELAEDVRAIPLLDALSRPRLEVCRDGGNERT